MSGREKRKNRIPNYVKIAYWIFLEKREVTFDEVCDFFHLNDKQINFYISVIQSREDVISCVVTDKRCKTTGNKHISVLSISKEIVDTVECDFSFSRHLEREKLCENNEVTRSYLWHMVLKTKPLIL